MKIETKIEITFKEVSDGKFQANITIEKDLLISEAFIIINVAQNTMTKKLDEYYCRKGVKTPKQAEKILETLTWGEISGL